MIKSKPDGMTLIEVMISLAILSVISIMSIKILGGLNFSTKKIDKQVEYHRGFTGFWRLLEKDFFEISFISTDSIKQNLFINNNSLVLPNGVVWQWDNGLLVRKSYESNEVKKLEILSDVKGLKLDMWKGKKFVPYSSNVIGIVKLNSEIGFKVTLVQESSRISNRIFILQTIQK